MRRHSPDQRLPVWSTTAVLSTTGIALAFIGFWFVGPFLRRQNLPSALSGAGGNPVEGPDIQCVDRRGPRPAGRVLADGILEEAPEAEVEIVDPLALVNPLVRRLVLDSSRFHSKWGNRVFDLSYKLITDVRPTRWFAARLTQRLAARPIRRTVLEQAPDVVVSTYPGTTEVLGDLRAKGKIDVPVVSAITDLASLRFWAHRGVDLHLITHPESVEEVLQIAPGTEVIRVDRGRILA